jgi:REP element-mobilizing transposase RayT
MTRTLAELEWWSAVEKEKMRELIEKLVAFSGLRLVTFCIMGNHAHLLVEVPTERESLRAMSDSTFLDRLELIYSDDVVQRVGWQLETFRESGMEAQALALRERYLARMHNLSAFMAELKQRFSQYYNAKHRRRGTVWRDRFKSVVVEDSEDALRTMAAYIDLNPVRAGLVEDPKDYRWSGYAEAVAGKVRSQQGLMHLVRGELGRDAGTASWKQVSAIYRCWLYEEGRERRDETGQLVIKRGFDAEAVDAVVAKQGALARRVLVKMRVRQFSEGVALGSRAFVEEVFEANREHFGKRRVDEARKMRQVKWGGLLSLRDLRDRAPAR